MTEQEFATRINEWGRGSVNVLRNTNEGALTAPAQVVHRGRSTIVVDVRVTDEQDRRIARLTATQLAPGSAVQAAR